MQSDFLVSRIADLHANSYALFKAKDKKLLDDSELDSRLQTAEQINNEYAITSIL